MSKESAGTRRMRKEVVASERIEDELSDLSELIDTEWQGFLSRRPGDRREPDGVTDGMLTDRLREVLEDEVVPAYPPTERGLLHGEFDREIQKKALVGLHLETLKRLANERLLDTRGNSEHLAERIARLYRYDDSEIARLVVENEDQPTEENSHQSRFFPLVRSVETPTAARHLRAVERRLVRAGVARWLEVTSISTPPRAVETSVELHTYRAYVDETSPEPELRSAPEPGAKTADLRLAASRSVIEVHNANASTSRIAARSVAGVIRAEFTQGLPIIRPTTQVAGTFDERTSLLLDLVFFRMLKVGVAKRNLTIARFVTEKKDKASQEPPEEAESHSLKAVRFEGNHVLNSPQACQFIARQRRGLVDISMRVSIPTLVDEGEEAPWFPVRLTLDRDHIVVMTGFGRSQPQLSGQLHRGLLSQAEEALANGPLNAKGLEELAADIMRVAGSEAPKSLGS